MVALHDVFGDFHIHRLNYRVGFAFDRHFQRVVDFYEFYGDIFVLEKESVNHRVVAHHKRRVGFPLLLDDGIYHHKLLESRLSQRRCVEQLANETNNKTDNIEKKQSRFISL